MTKINSDYQQKNIVFTKKRPPNTQSVKQKWSKDAITKLFNLSFNDLLFKAHTIHRENFDPNSVQLSTLLSIKTGGCSEDCSYCPQSARYNTEVDNTPILNIEEVMAAARAAKDAGASRFCMGAAWRGPKQKDLDLVKNMVSSVKSLGLETCATLGMLKDGQAEQLKDAGLDYYNHNLDTSPEMYGDIITTRTYQDRLDTLDRVRQADINVCCGGIVGLGENISERVGLIEQLANLVEGTPAMGTEPLDHFEFVKTIAVARITMPKSFVRLSAGRETMDDGVQALAFFAGANSIFYGDELLTTGNPNVEKDQLLFKRLGLKNI